jgi:hypothetical protein
MVRKLEEKTLNFECQGRKFFVNDTISFNRFEKLKEFSLEFGFSATFQDIFMNLKKAWEELNKLQLADASVIIHNIMKGITILEQKEDVSFRIAALFINEQSEDDTEYNESKMKEKVECWAKEFDATFFFNFAAGLVRNWMSAYDLTLKDITEKNNQTLKDTKSKNI